MTPEDMIKALEAKRFKVEDKRPERNYFVVACKRCSERWSLGIKNGDVHPGNVLALLNHAAGHVIDESEGAARARELLK